MEIVRMGGLYEDATGSPDGAEESIPLSESISAKTGR